MDHSDLQQVDPDVLEHYGSFSIPHSMGLSSLPPGKNDEGIGAHVRPKRKYRHVYQHRKRRTTTMCRATASRRVALQLCGLVESGVCTLFMRSLVFSFLLVPLF